MFPDIQPDDVNEFKEFKEYMKRHPFIPWPDPYVPSMPFKNWKEMMDKRYSVIVFDEPTQIKPKLIATFNPAIVPSWAKELREWLKNEENETEI